MSALAQVLLHWGNLVTGSDRSRDRGENLRTYSTLEEAGMVLVPQDGTGVGEDTDVLVVSTAVEETIPDVRFALEKRIPIRKRAEVLADLFNGSHGVAIGGTSGKTTVTGMIGSILKFAERNPTVINGGVMLNEVAPGRLGNTICGGAALTVIEADESDGTISLYEPAISVLTNISMDHKPLPELRTLFRQFCSRARDRCVINLDCAESRILADDHALTFSLEDAGADLTARDIRPSNAGVGFKIEEVPFRLKIPGRHNVSNALAASAACLACDVSTKESAEALANFDGIRRRLEVVGSANNITVLDDFAHNPDKIRCSLATLKELPGRLLLMFQPTGFAPTRFLMDGLIEAFREGLDVEDLLWMPSIYYAGGTAEKDICSTDLIDPIRESGIRAEHLPDRSEIGDRLVGEARLGDRIVIMGARDDTLGEFARQLVNRIRDRV